MFLSALSRPRAERAAWVAAECRGDDGLLREVEQLLLHYHETIGDAALLEPVEADERVPERLGEFVILAVLGRGGMGVVYRAQRGSEPPVALKVLRPGLLTPELLSRFGHEAELLSRLDHPGIARFLETGLLDGPGGAQPYFAMTLVEGQDLRRWAASPRSLAEQLELLARVCDAVEHAHRQGIVHRDLKPENILVRGDASPCVLDFGVARLTESDYRATTLMTSAGVLVGTVRYMSPEQADARPGGADARSDVYALGIITHELVSGVMPYDIPTDSIHRALVAVLTAPPRPLPQVPGARGRALEAVIGKALAKAAEERYASAAELAAELRRVAAGQRPLARPRRRPRTLPRIVPILAVAVVVAFVAGQWLGGQDWFRVATPRLAVRDLARNRSIALLDSAASRIHGTAATAVRVQECLSMCDSARTLLGRVREAGPERLLERVAWGLTMEAHLRLAELTLEPGEYEACIGAGEEVLRRPAARDEQVLMPTGAGLLFEHLANARYEEPHGVMALAAARLARFSQPRSQLERALAWNREALTRLEERPDAGSESGNPTPMLRGLARHVLLGERAGMLSRHASLTDSPAEARDAVQALASSVIPGALDSDRWATGRYLLRSGIVLAVRGRLERDAASLDSALTRLRSALSPQSAVGSGVLETETRLALAETGRWRARLHTSPALARGELKAARRALERSPAGERANLHPRYLQMVRLRRAQVDLDLAVLDGSRPNAESVLVALARAESLFTPTTHPVICSEIAIERARANALLWTLTGDRFMREAALRRLAAARDLVPADEDPGRARRVELALAALQAGARRRADLDYPVASGTLSAREAQALRRRAGLAP